MGLQPRPPFDLALDLSNDRVFLTVRGDAAAGPSRIDELTRMPLNVRHRIVGARMDDVS